MKRRSSRRCCSRRRRWRARPTVRRVPSRRPPHSDGRGHPGGRTQERGQAPPGHLRVRHARHGLPVGPERPELVRRPSADQAAGVRERVRRGRPLLRRGPPEPARREGLHPDRRRRDQDHLRVRALRHRCRRRADHVPPAPRLGRARAVRSRPDLEPVHGPRRLPELGRVLGPERDGLLPERPGSLDAVVRAGTRASRSPSRGPARPPTRASTPDASSSRASRAASRCPTSRPSSATRRAGATCRWPASSGR